MRDDELRARRDALDDLLADLTEAQSGAKDAGSWQGYSAIVRQVLKVREEMAALDDRIQATADDMTEEELRAELRQAAGGMPLPHLEVFVSEYDRRTGGGRLRVIEGGSP